MNLKKKINYKQITYTLLGIFILGLGIGLANISGLGASSIDSFNEISSRRLNIPFSTFTFFAQIIMVIITLLIYRDNIGLGTILAMFLTQFPIALIYKIINPLDNLLINILMVLIGTILISFGASLIINSKLGMSTLEALQFSLAYRLNVSYIILKYSMDAIFLFLTYLLKGNIGIGTIISYLLTGKLIEYFNSKLKI